MTQYAYQQFFLIEIRFEVYRGGVQREAVVRQTTGATNRRIGGDGDERWQHVEKVRGDATTRRHVEREELGQMT